MADMADAQAGSTVSLSIDEVLEKVREQAIGMAQVSASNGDITGTTAAARVIEAVRIVQAEIRDMKDLGVI